MARNPLQTLIGRAAAAILVAAASVALLTAPGAAAAQPSSGAETAAASKKKGAKSKQRRGKKSRARARARAYRRKLRRMRRLRRLNRTLRLSGNTAVARRRVVQADSSASSDVLDAGFEQGLMNWNTAGVGEVIPTVTGDVVRSGGGAGRFALSGDQHRSELILGGNGNGSADDAVRFYEGDEYYYAFSFYIESMVYGEPGAHNLIMQFKGDDDGSPYFGLQLWDYEGDDGESGGRGLWSHGEGMDGDRFLSPVAERQWHDVLVHFRASSQGNGFYEVHLNGRLVDAKSGIDMFPSYADHAYIKGGLYRNGDEIPGTSEIRLDAVRLGRDAAAVAP